MIWICNGFLPFCTENNLTLVMSKILIAIGVSVYCVFLASLNNFVGYRTGLVYPAYVKPFACRNLAASSCGTVDNCATHGVCGW